jgi:hypothetical protein
MVIRITMIVGARVSLWRILRALLLLLWLLTHMHR